MLNDLNPNSGTVRIPARSRHQAMDWSLVLASQGIDCVIERTEESADWSLVVADSESQRAIASIRKYHTENRGWGWRRQRVHAGFVFDWTAMAWAVLLAVFFWLNENRVDLQTSGAMDSAAIARGQWWRLFTAIWLHADAAHVAANATIGFILLGLAMGLYGTGLGLLAAYVAGASGNALADVISAHPHHSLGASGMVMGALGLLVIQGLPLFRPRPSSSSSPVRRNSGEGGSSIQAPPPLPGGQSNRTMSASPSHPAKLVPPALVAGVMLFILLGLSSDPRTDIVAHLGGFLGGIVLGPIIRPLDNLNQPKVVNVGSWLLFGVLVILPWWLALANARPQP
jgi:membrane associated rhomboid family serine protease